MPQPAPQFRSALPRVLVFTVLVFFSVFSRGIVAPLLVAIAADLSISIGRATQIFLVISAGYLVSMVTSGFVAARIGNRRTVVVSVFVTSVGLLLTAWSRSVGLMFVAFAVTGMGGGLYPGSGLALVANLVADRDRGKALAFHEMGPNVSFVLAPVIAGMVLVYGDWRLLPLATGLTGVGIGLLMAFSRVGGDLAGTAPRFSAVKDYLVNRSFLALMALLTLAVIGAYGVYAILPAYLIVTRGMDTTTVNSLVGLSRVSGIAVAIGSGAFIDRFGTRLVLKTVLIATGVFTIALGLADGALLIVAVLLQPAVIAAFFPAVLTAAAKIGPPQSRNIAMSLLIPVANLLGGGVAPSVLGVLEAHGRLPAGFVGMGVSLLAGLLLIRALPQDRTIVVDGR